MSHAEYLNDYEAKHQILEVGRRMYEKGFVASNDGNISCRVSETELWTTPTGVAVSGSPPARFVCTCASTGKIRR